jgi:hypothetical protein
MVRHREKRGPEKDMRLLSLENGLSLHSFLLPGLLDQRRLLFRNPAGNLRIFLEEFFEPGLKFQAPAIVVLEDFVNSATSRDQGVFGGDARFALLGLQAVIVLDLFDHPDKTDHGIADRQKHPNL